MKKLVSVLLTLIIALSCAQAALAEEEQAAVDCIRLKTENGYVLVVTYDARYAVPGEKPEVVLTFADGTEQTKTADEILHQVFTDEEKSETYPQLFIQCGEEKPECSVSIGEGAFCDENGVQSPLVELAAEDFKDESYNIHWNCAGKKNILTWETLGPIKTNEPIETEDYGVTGRYQTVWMAASRIYLGEAQTESEQSFLPPAESEQLTVLCRLNDFVWDDYTFVWHDETNDEPDELSFSERMGLKKESVLEGFELIWMLATDKSFLNPLCLVIGPFFSALLVGEIAAMLFDCFFSRPPQNRWEYTHTSAD